MATITIQWESTVMYQATVETDLTVTTGEPTNIGGVDALLCRLEHDGSTDCFGTYMRTILSVQN